MENNKIPYIGIMNPDYKEVQPDFTNCHKEAGDTVLHCIIKTKQERRNNNLDEMTGQPYNPWETYWLF